MRTLSAIWTLVKNLIAIGLYIGMLSVADTPFQTVTVCGLGLIYITVIAYGSLIVRAQLNNTFLQTEQFHRLIRIIDHKANIELDVKMLEEEKEDINKGNLNYYINMSFIFIIWFISVWSIIQAILA